jgi:enolase
MISVIIPTLNEEKYLPLLLESLKRQTHQDFEVIVADAGSKDKTQEIAEKWRARIVEGGLPAAGRNKGAKKAKGDILFFMDSDVILPKEFIEKTLKEMEERNLDVAACYTRVLSDKNIDAFMYGLGNLYFGVSQFLNPKATGRCIIVKKKIHQEIKGFDEKIKLLEDFDYIKRAARAGKFRYLNSQQIPTSVRRLDKEGRMTMAVKLALVGLYYDLFGGVKSDVFKYNFAHYDQKKESLKEKIESLNLKIKITSRVKSIKAREILDSRGNPTVEVDLAANGSSFRASVPSGASKGKYEAKELRDGGRRYQGKGVLKAVRNVNRIIAPKLEGKYVISQKKIDSLLIKLDGRKNKSRLGANAILAVSMASCRAGAEARDISLYQHIADIYNDKLLTSSKKKFSLPKPCFNVINGGAHAGNDLDVQEFMIIPQMNSFSKNLEQGTAVYHCLKGILKLRFGKSAINLGDEGGFAPPLKGTEEALNLIMGAIKKAGFSRKIKIGLDVAANQFYRNGKYYLEGEKLDSGQLLSFYKRLVRKYPILFIEDPFAEEDFKGFKKAKKALPEKVIILGDDLLTTNIGRIRKAQRERACSGVIIKPNQVGTVIETIEAAKLAKSYDWKILASHRSGDTSDSFISDLAVGIEADFIKAGAPARGERLTKYNRLLRIEEL